MNIDVSFGFRCSKNLDISSMQTRRTPQMGSVLNFMY
jgi:hypothetical protein